MISRKLLKAFERGDVSFVRKQGHRNGRAFVSAEVAEMAFHKARLECLKVSDAKRRESLEWLRARGLKRMTGAFLPSDIWGVNDVQN